LKTFEFDENTVKISWEQKKSNTPTRPQMEKNLGRPGACRLTHSIGSKKYFRQPTFFGVVGVH
jgi:hypothetical protein